MKGTVPSNNGPEINSVTPMGSELGGSRPGNASGNGSIIRTSAAMLGLAIASGIFIPEGGQAATESPIEPQSTLSSDLSNGSEAGDGKIAEMEPDTTWQPSILQGLSHSNQSNGALPLIEANPGAIRIPRASESAIGYADSESSEGNHNFYPSQFGDSGQALAYPNTLHLDKPSRKTRADIFSESGSKAAELTFEGSAVLESEPSGSFNNSSKFSRIQLPDARSEISGAMVIEPELTDTPISIVHQVRVGETLAQIAASHNLSIEELTLANRLADPNLIEVNQKLKVPQGQGEVASSPKVARAKLSESVDFQTGSFEPQGKIALDQLAQISKSEKSAEDSQSQVFEADSESILSSRVEAYQPMTLASSQEQVESDASGVQAATNNIYTNRLRAEVDRLREEYRAQKLDQLVPIADSNGTPSSNREDLNPAVDVTVQPLHRINPEFNLEAYSQQKLAAADKGHPPKSFSEFTQSSTEGTKVALAADQFPVRSDSEPPVVATAPLGSSAYDPLKNPALGLIVSPDLPPMLGPDAYLPGSSPQFNGYIWPSKGVLTSGYGWRWGRMHKGIDIAGPIGTPVVAAAPGLITYAGWNDGGYGYLVEIEHGDGSLTLYAHNDRIVVNKGQKVAQGQHISDMGSTGRSTGPHLHFEIHPKGKDAVNPMAMLPRNSDSAQAY